MTIRAVLRLGIAVLVLFASGCVSVAPYQRGFLARDDMALETNPGMTKALEKTYAAKEAASGSATVGGGGCGCN